MKHKYCLFWGDALNTSLFFIGFHFYAATPLRTQTLVLAQAVITFLGDLAFDKNHCLNLALGRTVSKVMASGWPSARWASRRVARCSCRIDRRAVRRG